MKENDQKTRNIKDQGAKLVFGEPVLCAQFLHDYIPLDTVHNIRPNQIENITERFISLWDGERNSDVVNRIHLDGPKELYLITIIEHQTEVDFTIPLKLLRYMLMIWTDFEKEMEKKQPGITRQKDFLYPPILPIVYYEGLGTWSAARLFSEKIELSEVFTKYIPDFSYEVVRLHDYSNHDLIQFGDELSLIMLVNKLRNSEDFKKLKEVPKEYLERLEEATPEYLLTLISNIVAAFMHRLNVPKEEVADFTDQILERRIRMLFDSFEGYDVQETRRISKEEGIKEGELLIQIKQIQLKRAKGIPPSTIEEHLMMEKEQVMRILKLIEEHPDKTPQGILSFIMK